MEQTLSGIYQIKNLVNNKIYIGSTTIGFKNRWKVHIYQLNNNKHGNIYLQRSWNKYNKNNFHFSIIEIVEDSSLSLSREQHYLDTLKPEFNINKTAGSNFGMKHSSEARKKISMRHKGIPKSKDHVEKVRLANLGKKRGPQSEERKAKVSKPIVAISWSKNNYTVFPSVREAARKLNIERQHINSSIRRKHTVKNDFVFVFVKEFDISKHLKNYFSHYKIEDNCFLTLKEISSFLNKSQATAFRKIKTGEVMRYEC